MEVSLQPQSQFWCTDMVCSSYIVKHLLKSPLQGAFVSAFACVWHLHGYYCSPSIWIEPTAHWRFTTSYEKAQWLVICLCGSAGQRDGPRGQRGPQVDFREREQQLEQLWVCKGQSKTSERSVPCQMPQGAKETHFHPRPPSKVNKVITSWGGCPQSAKRQIICLMAGAASWNVVLLTDFSVYCFLWSPPLSPRLSCKVGLKQRVSKRLVNH